MKFLLFAISIMPFIGIYSQDECTKPMTYRFWLTTSFNKDVSVAKLQLKYKVLLDGKLVDTITYTDNEGHVEILFPDQGCNEEIMAEWLNSFLEYSCGNLNDRVTLSELLRYKHQSFRVSPRFYQSCQVKENRAELNEEIQEKNRKIEEQSRKIKEQDREIKEQDREIKQLDSTYIWLKAVYNNQLNKTQILTQILLDSIEQNRILYDSYRALRKINESLKKENESLKKVVDQYKAEEKCAEKNKNYKLIPKIENFQCMPTRFKKTNFFGSRTKKKGKLLKSRLLSTWNSCRIKLVLNKESINYKGKIFVTIYLIKNNPISGDIVLTLKDAKGEEMILLEEYAFHRRYFSINFSDESVNKIKDIDVDRITFKLFFYSDYFKKHKDLISIGTDLKNGEFIEKNINYVLSKPDYEKEIIDCQ